MGRKSNAQKALEAALAKKQQEEREELVAGMGQEIVEAVIDTTDDVADNTAPKKRGRKSKAKTAMPVDAKGDVLPDFNAYGVWSDERYHDPSELPIIKERMKIEIQLLRPSLGMSPKDPEALKYTAKKDDEMNIDGGTSEERAVIIWPKAQFIPGEAPGTWILVNEANCPQVDEGYVSLPFIYDYQIRGLFKDNCGLLSRSKNNLSADLRSYKKRIDGNIFVSQRKIPFNIPETYLDDNGVEKSSFNELGGLNTMARAIHITGPSGERSAISISEFVPPMSTLKFEVLLTDPKLREQIVEWFDYGILHGLGQWRNSGIGIFRWRQLDDNYEPIVNK